jgi:hypothetical protein
MFSFNPVDDIDLDSYAYQLYDIPNPTSSTTPIKSGRNKANVFTISVTNSTDSTPKTYYGRVAVVNTAGTPPVYTDLVSSGTTPLIEEQYISSLTAAKITAGTIGAHTITLGGVTSVIKSSTYNGSFDGTQWTTGSAGWLISGSGQAIFDSSQIRGSIAAASINLNTHNYWLPNAGTPIFKVGNASNFFEWNGTNVITTGTVITNATVSDGTVGGISAGTNKIFLGTGTYANANTPFYVDTSSRFSLGDKLAFDGTNLSIAGNVTIGSQTATAVSAAVTTANNAATAAANAQTTADGKINGAAVNANVTSISGGTITTGTINLNSVNVNTGTSGARLSIDSSGIKIYNSSGTNTVSLNSDGSASFSGSLSGATGSIGANFSIGTSCSIGGSLTIGNNVRVNGATADGDITTFKIRGEDNADDKWTLRTQRQDGGISGGFRNDGAFFLPYVYGDQVPGNSMAIRDLFIRSDGKLGYSSSSIRFKENIKNLDFDLDKFFQIQLVEFTYKNKESINTEESTQVKQQIQYGVIAEQLLEVGFNELVQFDKNDMPEYVDYKKISIMLFHAIKKMKLEIDSLAIRLSALENI